MASLKKSNSKKRGSVSLSAADREYLNERLGEARGRGAAGGGESEGGLFEALERFGLSSDRVERLRDSLQEMDVRESIDKAQEYLAEQIEGARDYARENPGKVIGGAAGVLVGASLLAMALRRAGGEENRGGGGRSRKSSGSKKSSPSKRSSSKKSSSKKSSSKKSSKRR